MGTDRTSAEDDDVEEDRLGITPRAVRAIFDRMRDVQAATKGATSFSAKLSYVELYNEELIDLLAGGGDARPTVQVREDKAGNIVWSGLREVKVTSAADVMKCVPSFCSVRKQPELTNTPSLFPAISPPARPSARRTLPT